MNKRIKIYSVEFMSYTNSMRDTVSDWDGTGNPMKHDTKYLTVGPGPFLIRESDIDYYRKFGQGIKDLHFVGYLDEPEPSYGDRLKDMCINDQLCKNTSEDNDSSSIFTEKVTVGDGDFDFNTVTGPYDPNITAWNSSEACPSEGSSRC